MLANFLVFCTVVCVGLVFRDALDAGDPSTERGWKMGCLPPVAVMGVMVLVTWIGW